MPLSVEEIAAIVRELSDPLRGARIGKVYERDAHSILLALKLPHAPAPEVPPGIPGELEGAEAIGARGTGGTGPEEGPPRKLFLLLSVRPRFERVHLVEEKGAPAAHPGPFVRGIEARILGARLQGIRQPGRGRAVEIDLEPIQGEGRPPSSLILVAELASGSSNLALLDGGRRLLSSLSPIPAGGAWIEEGGRYAPESPPPHPSAMAGITASPWRYLPEGSPEGAGPLSRLFPFNLALGRYYGKGEAESSIEERREALAKRIRDLLKKRRTLLSRLEEDLAGAEMGEGCLRLGELLKAEIARLRRGMSEVEVLDYYSPDFPRVRISLDPARTPQENIERYFQKYKKSLRAVPVIRERLGRVREEIHRLEEAAASVLAEGDESVLAELEARWKKSPSRRPPRPAPGKKESPQPSGPLRFVSRDGLEILVGRNGRENDELTFRLARGNDIFLHISGRPGAHVVVRTEKGKPPPLETLLDAAQLVLYYSMPVRSRGEVIRGAAGDVDYVEVKHVRKPRNGKPGEVLLARHRTLRVRLEEERLSRLRGESSRGTGLPLA